jgi:hypothetical protein
MSTAFHPQMDGQTERANKDIGQIFRTVIRHDQKNWVEKTPMVEFAINASVSSTTGFAPFELNSGFIPAMIKELRSNYSIPKGIKAFAEQALSNLAEAHDAIIEARVFQTCNANKRRGREPVINTGNLVYLSTRNLNLPKNRARKLCPKYIGPYKVAKANPNKSNYTLELPTVLAKRGIHPTFHISLLRPYQASDDATFPNRTQPEQYDFGLDDKHKWFVDEIIGHHRDKHDKIELEVRWSLGDTTWETYQNCRDLVALDKYLELHDVQRVNQLPKRK